MNTCHSFLEAMRFKGLPFHFLLRLKYKEKKGRERGREIETTDREQDSEEVGTG